MHGGEIVSSELPSCTRQKAIAREQKFHEYAFIAVAIKFRLVGAIDE